jgi:hypothetical protein
MGLYVYGIKFIAGQNLGQSVSVTIGAGFGSPYIYNTRFEKCLFHFNTNGNQGCVLTVGATGGPSVNRHEFIDCVLKTNTSTSTNFVDAKQGMIWRGGGMDASSTTQSVFVGSGSMDIPANCTIEGADFSNCPATFYPVGGTNNYAEGEFRFINCRFPNSWSRTLMNCSAANWSPTQGRIIVHNCHYGTTTNVHIEEDAFGRQDEDVAVFRTNGAKFNTTSGYSWKITTKTNAVFPANFFRTCEMVIWNETVGSSVTVTCHLVHDTNVVAGQGAGTSFAFRNDEVWGEVTYLGSTTSPVSTFTSSQAAVLATPADVASDTTESWTTTGLTTPVKQKISFTFTPRQIGFIRLAVCVAKASKTLYVCPELELT